jgi:aryl sulfotransferase
MSGAIWLASYPRSGNTWTRLALRSLSGGGEEVDLGDISTFGRVASRRELIDRELEVDSGLLTERETQELRPDMHAVMFGPPRPETLVKTHDAWLRTPSGRPIYAKAFTHAAIYLLRDPRDVAVSWARFNDWTLDRTIDYLADESAFLGHAVVNIGVQLRQPMGSWSSHARSWLDESDLEPLLVRYEDMVADPHAAFRAMAQRIGWDSSDEAVAGAVVATTFDRLRDKEARHGFLEKAQRTDRFFRSGKAGNWREHLSPAQAARLERDHGAVMARFGYL